MLSERELAFIAVYRDSYPRIHKYVLRRVDDAELAQELAADVFRVAWQKWDGEVSTEIPWLFTVARDELTIAEISQVLQCTQSSAKVRLHRAREAFRKILPALSGPFEQKVGA